MRFKVLPALLALAGALPLCADEARIWVNNTDRPWTVQLVARAGQAEKGNMNFTDLTGQALGPRPSLEEVQRLGLKETVLGEASAKSGGAKSVTLPKYSKWMVEFTHTSRAFYHAFRIEDAYGAPAGSYTCDDPATNIGGKFKVVAAGTEAPRAFLAVNAGKDGDLAINPSGYKLVNAAKDRYLKVRGLKYDAFPKTGYIQYLKLKFSDGAGCYMPSPGAKAALLDPTDADGWLIPPGEAVEVSGTDPRTLSQGVLEVSWWAPEYHGSTGNTVMMPMGAKWALGAAFDPAKPYPGCAAFTCLNAKGLKPIPDDQLQDLAAKGVLVFK